TRGRTKDTLAGHSPAGADVGAPGKRGRATPKEGRRCETIWLKMSVDSDHSCVLLSSRDPRISCVFQAADENDDHVQAAGEESVLEMLSCSKFSDLETWLCMPSSLLLPRLFDSARTSSSSSSSCASNCRRSSCSDGGAADGTPERDAAFLAPTLGKETPFLVTPLLPILSSTPDAAAAAAVSIRKRRRLAASPGGLCWKSTGSLWSPEPGQEEEEEEEEGGPGQRGGGACERLAVRKTLSVDERLLRPSGAEQRHLKLLGGLERGRKKLRNIHSLGTSSRFDLRKKSDGKLSRLAERRSQRAAAADDLIKDLNLYTGSPRTWRSLDRRLPAVMSQQMQNLQLSQSKKVPGGPASPNAAKRLYRNLSEKLRGSTSSFEDASFFGKTDRLRKTSTMQGGECLFSAVEQQDLDAVQILLRRLPAEQLDLNTANGQGLAPLDVAVMTGNAPIARMLLKAGGREGPRFVSAESRSAHLAALLAEAEQRAAELSARAQRDGVSLEACHKDTQLRAWEWRCKLYRRMSATLQQARPPETPTLVRVSVSSSSTLTVTFQEPRGPHNSVVTKYRVEWSCLKDFSLLAGEMLLENLQSLKCTISGLTTGRVYYVRVRACNVKGWGSPACSSPPSAAPSSTSQSDGRDPRRRSHTEGMERLLQQVRATHSHHCCGDASKLPNAGRKQSVSRSLKHLFNSSNKFVKTLKRGIYLAAIFYHKDKLLVTAEEQIPIVEVDDAYGSSLVHDFLWFTKLSCMWEDVRWLRQSTPVSPSWSSTLQARHKLLSAAGQMQNLLGTHDLGRAHYEPIKDRHGNALLVTVRDADGQHAPPGGKWVALAKVQSQRKSLSTPEEPYALDVLVITLQDIVAFQRRSGQRLAPGLYLGYLKLSSSVDQIRVLVSQRTPNMLCHARVRENANVSKEEWDWIGTLSAGGADDARPGSESHAPLLYYELQTAIKNLLKNLNLPLQQARHLRLSSQEVVELGHGVCFLLLLPAADDVCSAPGQSNPYTPLSGFLHLPLQMFELVHFCTYKEKFISLYCRLSTVLDLDALITQQALREAITDGEVASAKHRHQLILDYIQQLDETRRDLRWLTDALQYARYKHPRGGVPITCLVAAGATDDDDGGGQQKTDSTSSAMDYLPSPSPELCRRKAISDSLPGSDEDASSEVFLPTDSDYDSSDALSPRELDLLYSPPQDLSRQAVHSLGGSAPDVLQIHELRYSAPPVEDPPPSKDGTPPLVPDSPSLSKDLPAFAWPLPTSPSAPLSPRLSAELPLSLALCPALCHATETLEGLSLSRSQREGGAPRPRTVPNPPSKRKLLSRSHRGQYFSGPQRWLRGHSGESHTGSLSEGVYTKQREPDLPSPSPPPPAPPGATYVSRTDCVLESRKGRLREQRPHVRRIFVDRQPAAPAAPARSQDAEREPQGASGRDVDSDEQTNAQVSDILSSTL
ncbi:ankyrin repeat and fibronectin type-III domain-containing protein 1, partial [Vanacampus margaritifer]